MEEKNLKFFRDLVEAHSPSGFEAPAQKVARVFMAPYADEITSDINGNLIALKRGSGDLKVMVVGHADEIGFLVNHIDESGYLYLKPLGGFDVNLLPGLRLDIHHGDEIIRGIIGRKPVHMMRGEEGGGKLKMEELWVDIGAKDKEDALKRVSIGDTVTYHSDFEMLSDDLIVSKATDNKAGVLRCCQSDAGAERQKAEGKLLCRVQRGRRNHDERRRYQCFPDQTGYRHRGGCDLLLRHPRFR